MDVKLQRLVWSRAEAVCEYCKMPEQLDSLPFAADHIISQKHHGATVESNLALACYNCNSYKGPNIAGLDPETQELTRLFSPRQDVWGEHFAWNGPEVAGLSAIGRTTIDVLRQ